MLQRAADAVDVVPHGGDDGHAALGDGVALRGGGPAALQARADVGADAPVVRLEAGDELLNAAGDGLEAAAAEARGALAQVRHGVPVPLVMIDLRERVGEHPRAERIRESW